MEAVYDFRKRILGHGYELIMKYKVDELSKIAITGAIRYMVPLSYLLEVGIRMLVHRFVERCIFKFYFDLGRL